MNGITTNQNARQKGKIVDTRTVPDGRESCTERVNHEHHGQTKHHINVLNVVYTKRKTCIFVMMSKEVIANQHDVINYIMKNTSGKT